MRVVSDIGRNKNTMRVDCQEIYGFRGRSRMGQAAGVRPGGEAAAGEGDRDGPVVRCDANAQISYQRASRSV